jgi:uncharacterized protein YjbI with pentapeptide repeats
MFEKTVPVARKLTPEEQSAIAVHQSWLASGLGQRADLREHDFSNADLKSVDLRGAVLGNCDFSGSDLSNALF